MYWDARGYNAFPPDEQDRSEDRATFPAWQEYANLLARARRGEFDAVGGLVGLHDRTPDWVLRGAYIQLLGDAAKTKVLQEMKENLPKLPVEYQYDYGEALAYWGSLSAVPTLVDLYAANYEFDDGRFIPPRLSRVLEQEPGPVMKYPFRGPSEAVAAYCQVVLARCQELKNALGEDAVVFRGEKLSVAAVARRGLDDLAKDKFDEETRHKFEAMTGIDCSSFYKDGELQPLAAAALLEEFLEGPEPAKYEEGVRYFYGRPIDPDVPARRPARS
jgi:hypothetical protein